MKRTLVGQITLVMMLMILASGCSRRMMDYTIISSKNMQLQIPSDAMGPRVEGRDEVWVVIVPFGTPNIKEAVDRAIESAGPGYDALIDGVLYQTMSYYVLASKIGFRVEGTPIRTSVVSLESTGEHGNRPVIYHSSHGISNEDTLSNLKIVRE